MIFVITGSQKFQFNRLLKKVDEIIENGSITEEVFAQIGYSDYVPQKYPWCKFLNQDEFADKINLSDIIITHGGSGTIMKAVKYGKKIIAVPRLAIYKEHVDNHQRELLRSFERMNLISACYEINQLADYIKEVRYKKFVSYQSNTENIINDIDSFLIENIEGI